MNEHICIGKIIEEVCEKVCTELCAYAETIDEDCECDYIREHGSCPLERLI